MNGSQLVNRLVMASVLAACVLGGTAPMWGDGGAATTTSAPPSAVTAPPIPAPEEPVAVINGKAINNEWFRALLMQVAGRRVFPQAMDLILVQQACAASGIMMEGKDFTKLVQEEIDRTLANLNLPPEVKPEERGQALAILLQQRGVTNEEFIIGMHISAGLRALSSGRVSEPTKAEVDEGFIAQYGEKVQVKVLSVPTLQDASDVRKDLDGGQDIEDIIRKRRIPTESMTISSNAKIEDNKDFQQLKDWAFAPATKEKQLSAGIPHTLSKGLVVYLGYLDKKIAKQNVKFEDVKSKVEASVMAVKQQAWMNTQMQSLRQMAVVKINDKILLSQYEELVQAQKRAETQAASQAASQPATAPGAATRPK